MNLGSAAAVAPMAGACAPLAAALPANFNADEVRGQLPVQPPAALPSRLGERFARALEEQGADEEAGTPRETEPPAGLLPWPPAQLTPRATP